MLVVVLLVFSLLNVVVYELGLFVVIVMGIVLGNMCGVYVDDIFDFKEYFIMLLVLSFFILFVVWLMWFLLLGMLMVGIGILLVL